MKKVSETLSIRGKAGTASMWLPAKRLREQTLASKHRAEATVRVEKKNKNNW